MIDICMEDDRYFVLLRTAFRVEDCIYLAMVSASWPTKIKC